MEKKYVFDSIVQLLSLRKEKQLDMRSQLGLINFDKLLSEVKYEYTFQTCISNVALLKYSFYSITAENRLPSNASFLEDASICVNERSIDRRLFTYCRHTWHNHINLSHVLTCTYRRQDIFIIISLGKPPIYLVTTLAHFAYLQGNGVQKSNVGSKNKKNCRQGTSNHLGRSSIKH